VSVQFGKTTTFLKAEDYNRLEKAKVDQLDEARVKLQAFARSKLEQQKHSQRKEFLDRLEKSCKAFDQRSIEAFLNGAEIKSIFPKGAEHIASIRRARQLLEWIVEEEKVASELILATSMKEISKLDAAITKAEKLTHDVTGKVAKMILPAKVALYGLMDEQAKREAETQAFRMEEIRQEEEDRKAREEIRQREMREREMEREKEFELEREKELEERATVALPIIQRVVKRYLYEKRVKTAFEQLREAVRTKNLDLCLKWVRRMSDLGLRDHPEVLAAAKMLPERKKKPSKQNNKALAELEQAMVVARMKSIKIKTLRPEDVADLTYAINKAKLDGLKEVELAEAIDMEREMLLAVASKGKSSRWGWCCGSAISAVNHRNRPPRSFTQAIPPVRSICGSHLRRHISAPTPLWRRRLGALQSSWRT